MSAKTRREKSTQQRSDSVLTYFQHMQHAAHAAGSPLAARPAPNRAGRPCRALLYVPQGVNSDLADCQSQQAQPASAPPQLTSPENLTHGIDVPVLPPRTGVNAESGVRELGVVVFKTTPLLRR